MKITTVTNRFDGREEVPVVQARVVKTTDNYYVIVAPLETVEAGSAVLFMGQVIKCVSESGDYYTFDNSMNISKLKAYNLYKVIAIEANLSRDLITKIQEGVIVEKETNFELLCKKADNTYEVFLDEHNQVVLFNRLFNAEELYSHLNNMYNDLVYNGHMEHIDGFLPEWFKNNVM